MTIKICGLFREDDVSFANDARPDYIGFVFAKSRRAVSIRQAASLREKLDPAIVPVGVFVNARPELPISLARDGVIDAAQLHGDEDEAYIAHVKAETGVPVIRAILAPSRAGIEAGEKSAADYLLLDSGAGSGKRFDWSVIGGCNKPYFLAGGIDAATIAEALSYRPFGVDVSSGVETGGVKDRAKMIALVRTVREASTL
ncbi:MAG: phosphoribosylanthranilate isomerase [Treponema sp.]|jgi:phosphoribosylanthranilate isomerase|nr:phosphoribosylanthranilate isomerase [Treponema sp.]